MPKIYTGRRTKSSGQSNGQSNVNTNRNHRNNTDEHEGVNVEEHEETISVTKQKLSNSNSDSPLDVPIELCEECQNSKSRAKYRPLVHSNGAFLCDTCYRTRFPATAMCDEDDNINILSKVGKNLRDKFENDDDGNDGYASEEECCTCLEHGIHRKCCNKFYCRECYFKNNFCPGCKAPNHRTGTTVCRVKPPVAAVMLSWAISGSVVLVTLLYACTLIANWVTKPSTIWGHTCSGWFPQCSEPVCLDYNYAPNLVTGSNLDPSMGMVGMPYDYKYCSVNDTLHKVMGGACVVDSELYLWSDKHLGFDLCSKSNRRGTDKNVNFENGVYVFEDNFDYWVKNNEATDPLNLTVTFDTASIRMKSAQWYHMENAQASNICGYNDIVRPYEVSPPSWLEPSIIQTRTNSSLAFTGVAARYAETIDLDVRNGGRVEFYLKLAPVVVNELATECKTAFNGDIKLSYSIDGGITFVSLREYPVWKYRHEHFALIKEDLPANSHTSSTRFKWEQMVFDPQRDHWALDDVRVFHSWPSRDRPHEISSAFAEALVANRRRHMEMKQCCYDTEQCIDFPNLRQNCQDDEKRQVERVRVGWLQDDLFRFKTAHIYLSMAVVILITRKGFQDLHEWKSAAKRETPFLFQDDDCGSRRTLPLSPSLTRSVVLKKKDFNLSVSKSWQRTAMLVLSLPHIGSFVLLLCHAFTSWDFYARSTQSFLFLLLPPIMDFYILRRLGIDVLHYWPFHHVPRIQVDGTTEKEILLIGERDKIPLLDIRDVKIYSNAFYTGIYASVWVGGFPFATSIILIKEIVKNEEVYSFAIHLLGISIILRSILGCQWFVEICLSSGWLLTLSANNRDEMGRACNLPGLRHASTNATILSIVIFLPLLLYRIWDQMNALQVIAIVFASAAMGLMSGSTISMIRGLPTVPMLYLTTWPNDGYKFVNDRKTKHAHLLSSIFSGGTNSTAFYIVPVEDMDTFQLLLNGSVTFTQLHVIENQDVDETMSM